MSMTGHRSHDVLDSPVGELTLLAYDGVLGGIYMTEQLYRPAAEQFGVAERSPFLEARRQLTAYFAGELTEFNLQAAPVGTPFQHRVWAQVSRIPYGQLLSYAEIAIALGQPGAARAVGAANGRNRLSIVVPCHRVVGRGGNLTGYGGGLHRKQHLLDFEASIVAMNSAGRPRR